MHLWLQFVEVSLVLPETTTLLEFDVMKVSRVSYGFQELYSSSTERSMSFKSSWLLLIQISVLVLVVVLLVVILVRLFIRFLSLLLLVPVLFLLVLVLIALLVLVFRHLETPSKLVFATRTVAS